VSATFFTNCLKVELCSYFLGECIYRVDSIFFLWLAACSISFCPE
jgi:hypothetical protein